jgi:TorA maturation chaperone TorD
MQHKETIDAELMEILRARESTYGLLSRIYRSEVSSELLRNLFDGLADHGDAGDGYALMQKFADSVRSSDPSELENQLAAEYAHLFLNAGAVAHVFPYESVYTSTDRLLMQEARDQVLEAYGSEGLKKVSDFKEPEDHIALELEFMAHLCRSTAGALETGEHVKALTYIAKQKVFLETHLLNWIPRFCDDLEQIAWSDFYRAVAQMTKQFLAVEPESMNEIFLRL